jgi:RHS repeat-associated protein
MKLFRLLCAGACALALALPVFAQKKPKENAKVLVSMRAAGYGVIGGQSLGVQLWEVGASPQVDTYASGMGHDQWVYSAPIQTLMTPGKHYQMRIGSGCWRYGEIFFSPPPGYSIRVNDKPLRSLRTPVDANLTAGTELLYKVVLVAEDGSESLAPGEHLPPRVGDVVWAVGLGRLSNGMPAGALQLRSSTISSALGASASLIYNPINTDEVEIIPDTTSPNYSPRRFISTPQAFVHIDDTVGTANMYDINFYAPSVTRTEWGTDSAWHMYNGTDLLRPYVRYRVRYLGTGQMSIERNDFDSSNGQLIRMEDWVLTQNGSNWTIDNTSSIRKVLLTSQQVGSNRVETVLVQDKPTTGTPATFAKYVRTYQSFPWGQEELVSEVNDPDGAALTTSYSYNTVAGSGGYARLSSVTRPDGSWEKYEYDDTAKGFGNLLKVHRPWQNIVTTPNSFAETQTHSSVYAYTGERGGDAATFLDLLKSQETRITGITTGRTEYTHDFSQTVNSQPMHQITTKTYSSASSYVTSTSTSYHTRYSDSGLYDFLGRAHVQKAPDGAQESYYYGYGNFSDGTWYLSGWDTTTFSPNANGNFVCESVLNGSSNSNSGGTLITSLYGASIAPVYMVPYRSTRTDIVRTGRGDAAWELRYVYTGGSSFQLLSFTKRSYQAGRLTGEKNSDGSWRQWSYKAGKLWFESNFDGTYVLHDYDALGRETLQTTSYVPASGGYAAINSLYKHFKYDAAGRMLSSKTSQSSDPAQTGIEETAQYNLAGLKTSSVSASGLTTYYSYSNSFRTTTVTAPGGATVITNKNLDGTVGSEVGTGQIAKAYTYSVNADGTVLAQTAVGGSSTRWTSKTTDWMGRAMREERPAFGGGISQKLYFYNGYGQLTRTSETGIADSLYQYDNLGQLQFTALDVNSNGAIDLAGPDRVSESRSQIVTQNNVWYTQVLNYTYNQSGSSTPLLTGESLTRLRPYGLDTDAFNQNKGYFETTSYDIFRNQTVSTSIIDRPTNTTTKRTDVPDSSADVLEVSRGGLVVSSQSSQGLTTTYQYDGYMRLIATVDPRVGATTQAYYDGTAQLGSRFQLNWVKDAANNVTTTYYDSTTGRVAYQTNPLGKSVRYEYDTLGHVVRSWGEAAYPVEYGFNSYGEQIKMRTFRDAAANFAGASWPYGAYPSPSDKGDFTTWNYDAATGLLASKVDAQNRTVSYTYNARGQLSTRAWARGVTTTYSYDPKTAEQTAITYSDGTPNITYTYDRRGLSASIVDVIGTRTFDHCDCGKVTAEYLPAFFQNREVRWFLDTTTTGAKGRTTSLNFGTSGNGTNEYSVGFGYDNYGRLNNVGGWIYGYTPNSNLIASVADSNGWTQYRAYETNRNLLASIETKFSTATKSKFAYISDALGRRTSLTQTGDLFASYQNGGLTTAWGYNDRSEVISSQTAYVGTSTAVLGRDFGYGYDPIGNRTTSTRDGATSTYTANSLNQYTQRTEPGKIATSGLAPAAANVTVNGQATTRQGEYYYKSYATSNTTAPVWSSLNINSDFGGSFTRTVFTPQTPEVYTYDNDGNILTDGRWTYTWDAENRLVAMETHSAAYNVGTPRQRLEFKYDYLGRRVQKRVASWSGSAWSLTSERRFIYDGWNVMAEFDTTSGYTMKRRFIWGVDLSGSLQDAGGVGGLLWFRDEEVGVAMMPAYDGNGNVYGMIDRGSGAVRAAYEYSSFGEILRSSGDLAERNPFRFSTKYTDSETQFLYYGFRYYSPSLGRFYGLDPSDEKGGLNLYAFCANHPVYAWDRLGMDAMSEAERVRQQAINKGEWAKHNMQQYSRLQVFDFDDHFVEAAYASWEEMNGRQEEQARNDRAAAEAAELAKRNQVNTSTFDVQITYTSTATSSITSTPQNDIPAVQSSAAQAETPGRSNQGFTISLGFQAGAAVGLQGSFSAQMTFSASGLDPLDWRFGETTTFVPLTGVSSSVNGGVGVLLSVSGADMPEKFNDWSGYGGASVGAPIIPGPGVGFDVSNFSKNMDPRNLNYNLYVGVKTVDTPYALPVEVHAGGAYTTGGSITVREMINYQHPPPQPVPPITGPIFQKTW